jgi:hypothetical protein
MITQKHMQELFLFAKHTFAYNPDKWGDTLQEAIQRTKDGYAVPYNLVRLLVSHMTEMQACMLSLDSAVEAKMVSMDEKHKALKEMYKTNSERLLTRTK